MTERMPTDFSDPREIYSVSEVNQQLKSVVASNFSLLWVEGEISNLARPASGHVYFTIKDPNSQLRCVMFRSSSLQVPFEISNGMQVIIRAKASVYEVRGDLQLIVDGMEEAGFGALQRQFEALKNKLFQEGLFDPARKKLIPRFPSHIAIITSTSGAAIKDFLKVTQRRYPVCKKTIFSVQVQGEQAASIISQAVISANYQAKFDVIVIIRGGGSIEDLWAFNDESLARTIADSKIPVISGIGHEIDYTIVDFVADLRAPTPSVAAELSCPEAEAMLGMIVEIERTLKRLSVELIQKYAQSTDWLSQRLQRTHPATVINNQKRALQGLLDRLQRMIQLHIKNHHYQLQNSSQKLYSQSPARLLELQTTRVSTLNARLQETMRHQLDQMTYRFRLCASTISAVSPLNTLQRGYSITRINGKDTEVIRDYSQVRQGDQLTTHLASGEVVSRVESTSSKNIIEKISSVNKDDV